MQLDATDAFYPSLSITYAKLEAYIGYSRAVVVPTQACSIFLLRYHPQSEFSRWAFTPVLKSGKKCLDAQTNAPSLPFSPSPLADPDTPPEFDRIWCILSLKSETSGGTNFTNFPENQLTTLYVFFSNCISRRCCNSPRSGWNTNTPIRSPLLPSPYFHFPFSPHPPFRSTQYAYIQSGDLGECCISLSGVWGRPQHRSNLVHFILKVRDIWWHQLY